jgi:hypothetical protein
MAAAKKLDAQVVRRENCDNDERGDYEHYSEA